MQETGNEHAGITSVVVYFPPPSTQVIRVQINEDFKVAGSIDTEVVWRTDQGKFHTSLVSIRCTVQQLVHNKVLWPLVGTQCLLGHFSCYTVLSFIEGRVSGTGLCEHTLWIIFSKAITLLRQYTIHTLWVLGFRSGSELVPSLVKLSFVYKCLGYALTCVVS